MVVALLHIVLRVKNAFFDEPKRRAELKALLEGSTREAKNKKNASLLKTSKLLKDSLQIVSKKTLDLKKAQVEPTWTILMKLDQTYWHLW